MGAGICRRLLWSCQPPPHRLDFGEVSGAIVTRISLRPDKDVPFPSLTISEGGPTDPLGFVRNSGDIVTWDDIEEEGIIWWFNAFKAGC